MACSFPQGSGIQDNKSPPTMEDGDFEVTAEMLIHEDVDDETTMEEEEAFQSQEENEEELTNLQEESEIPLEVLLSRYGYNLPVGEEKEKDDDKAKETNTTNSSTKQTTRLKQQVNTNTNKNTSDTIATTTTTTTTKQTLSTSTSQSETTNVASTSSEPINTPSILSVEPVEGMSKTGQTSSSVPTLLPHHSPVSRLPPPLIQVMPEENALDFEQYASGGHQLESVVKDQGSGSMDVMLSSSGSGLLGKHGRSLENKQVVADDHDAIYSDVMLACGESPISSETDEPSYRPSSSSKAAMTNKSSEDDEKSDPISSRLRSELPERRSIRLMNSSDRLMMENYLYLASLLEDDEEGDSDEEYVPREAWRQEVKVGQPHQAVVSDRPNFTPYSTECPPNVGELIWNPQGTTSGEVSKYLESISEEVTGSQNNGERDNEQALQVLQECNYNVKKAAEKIRRDGVSQGMLPWTEEECRNFEEGLQAVGKDFFTIRKKVPSRTVKEIVEFYYLWKKSERYDAFISQYGKIGKKKLVYPPGHISDFMEKYFDLYDNDAVDLHYGTTTVYAEVKRDSS